MYESLTELDFLKNPYPRMDRKHTFRSSLSIILRSNTLARERALKLEDPHLQTGSEGLPHIAGLAEKVTL
ncbi:MAG: hypothetical protein ACJA09_001779 [Alcanivorax sp.]|jgi:hypothetical protein